MDSHSVDRKVKALTLECRLLKSRVSKLERALDEQAAAKNQAAELERWKQLVPELRKYYR